MPTPSPVAIASRSRKLIAALGRKVAGMAAELGLLLEPGKYSIVLPTKAVKTPVSKWSWPAGSTSPDALRNHVRAVLRALGGVVQQGADLEAQRSAGHPSNIAAPIAGRQAHRTHNPKKAQIWS